MSIENATQEDVIALTEVGALMWAESPHYSLFDYDRNQVAGLLSFLIDDDTGIVLVVRSEGQVVGGFVGAVSKFWFSKDSKVMSDDALFIRPGFRGGFAVVRLLEEAFRQAKEKGAVEVQLANATGVFSNQVERLYQRIGMTRIGGYYYKLLGDAS